ncbi:HTH-type transcriptional regulator MalT [Paraburkholderia domus]|uniref:LuxR C-terminal-related transcriptional regulator n=1 Tax=Paraburkholderia domus TaxID=2793075 RepID=UPI001913BF4E|nr:LuxR C-terminal-related transcriptional regulator [Paraburkholderia domus]MBK5049041.1 LuxR family transcriptional regulator [Burkholderia sp. R-70006]CAE6734275.1 HTH-type transcriptional regulator MalT [Paraburkholderia domus]
MELTLKISPPRAPRHLLARTRLSSSAERFRDRPVAIVQAPPGFGKTSLLAQWRHEQLMRGCVVAWLSLDGRDDPRRLFVGLMLAVRAGSGRAAFGKHLLEGGAAPDAPLEAITAWLAEVARTALDIVLILDEAEPLPQASQEVLVYLFENLPANLRVVFASRGGYDKLIARLIPYGTCTAVDAATLRFRLDETVALIGSRFGADVDADTSARLHDITEGWPLGLQLALDAIADTHDPSAGIDAFASSTGGIQRRFVSALFERLNSDDIRFLTLISIVDLLHGDLCSALSGFPDARQRLLRLAGETPLLCNAQGRSGWYRLHAMAREVLRENVADLPHAELTCLHKRAMQWLADHGMTVAAARHALACGEEETAYRLVQRSLHETVTQGHLVDVAEWREWLPEAVLDRHPQLRIAIAWALAMSDRHQDAEAQAQAVLLSMRPDEATRYEIDLILSAAAYFADEPDRAECLMEKWGETSPVGDAWLQQVHANRLAARALMNGDYAAARQLQRRAPHGKTSAACRYVSRWRDYMTGLGYLFEGQFLLAERALRPALDRADNDLGRRHPFSCMIAALLAATRFKRGDFEEATALLANRLDVLERGGTPDAVILAYRTAARVAVAAGMEHRAIDLLGILDAIGAARNMPRLRVASLTEQIRLHSGCFRSATCQTLVEQLDRIVAAHTVSDAPITRRTLVLHQDISHAYVAIAAQDWRAAKHALTRAQGVAEEMRLGAARVDIMTLRAFVLDRIGETSTALLREAVGLGVACGMKLVPLDLHPAVALWMDAADGAASPSSPPEQQSSTATNAPVPERHDGLRATPSMALTPKERDVLELVTRHLTNKEIAFAMGIGQETVKWHMKNLFLKLDATSRKQIVRRAQLMGLLLEAA